MMHLLRRVLALVLAFNIAFAGSLAPADARMLFDPSGSGKFRVPGLSSPALTGLSGVNGIVAAGDSLTAPEIAGAVSYPTQLQRQTTKRVLNKGHSGYRVDQLNTSFYDSEVAPLYNAATFNTLVFLGGTNDVIQGASFTVIRDRLIAYWQKAKTTGFKLVICTLPAQGNINAGQITIQQSVNDWIRANWSSFGDALADLSAVAALSNPNDTTYYRADKLHFTTAGSNAQLQMIFTKLNLPVEMGTLGAEIITDGDFASGAGAWSLGAGWSVSGGTANKVAGTGGNLVRNISALPAGARVILQYDYSNFTAEYLFAYVNGHAEPNKSNAGSYTEVWISDGTINSVQFWPSTGAAVSVDNVSFRVINP